MRGVTLTLEAHLGGLILSPLSALVIQECRIPSSPHGLTIGQRDALVDQSQVLRRRLIAMPRLCPFKQPAQRMEPLIDRPAFGSRPAIRPVRFRFGDLVPQIGGNAVKIPGIMQQTHQRLDRCHHE